MAVTLMCPNLRCRKILVVPASARGTRVRCSYCQHVFVVPQAKLLKRKSPNQELIALKTGEQENKDGKQKKQ